ncbi:MAG: hypothetical protein ACRDRL_03980 [Sciscionella sp.]
MRALDAEDAAGLGTHHAISLDDARGQLLDALHGLRDVSAEEITVSRRAADRLAELADEIYAEAKTLRRRADEVMHEERNGEEVWV